MVSIENRNNVVFDLDTDSNYKKPSVISHDLIVREAYEEDDTSTEMPAAVSFVRGSRDSAYQAGIGLTSRLSTVIRRSLRLPPKRDSTVRQRTSESPTEKKPSPLQIVEEEKQTFTKYTDVKREPCPDQYGALKELQTLLRLNRHNHVKKFIRYNNWPVSHEIRAELWRVLCNNKDLETNKRLYVQQLDDLMKSGVKTFHPAFLSADGIVIHDHGLKQHGAVALQRLLIIIECVRPEIRYVPILYPLCAMFLHYMNPEDTFACMMRLLSQGHSFLLQSEVAMFASRFTILGLVKKHKRSIYNLLKRRLGTDDERKLAEVFADWAAWIFRHLPFEYLVRVVDCFLVEGHKMLLRITVALVYVWYKEKGKETPSSKWNSKSIEERTTEICTQVTQIAQNCPISVQTLLDVACAIRNLKFSTVERLQRQYEEKFRDEVSKRRAEREDSRRTRMPKRLYTAAFESVIIDSESASELMCALPSRFQLETPTLMFRLSEHGASFTQLWSLIDEAEQSLMIIRATNGRVFGAYCSASWLERRDLRERTKTRYFGTGESFVFMIDAQLQLPIVYAWVGKNSDRPDNCPQMFMTAGDKFLIIGSGGGDAIAIRDELSHGLSYPCETFGSPTLVPGNEFSINEMEVWRVIGTV
uniref:TBC1 domain family member 24 n=1 Tax=Acrobeloides nanus TaxID=290746 RepID=A0A914D956_9BILA